MSAAEALSLSVEYATCSCGHEALRHHGIDNDPVNGGCFGNGSGHGWSPAPKCACTRTCGEVVA